MKKQLLIRAFLLLVSAHFFGIEPVWSKILSADVITKPILFEDKIICLTEEGMLHCLDLKGNFLWSKLVKGKPFDFSVSQEGIIYTASASQSISAYSMNGFFLWKLPNSIVPEQAPYIGYDGRVFIQSKNKLYCFSSVGSIKWTLFLPQTDFTITSHDGNKNILLTFTDNHILQVSPFGQIINTIPLYATALKTIDAPNGFVASCINNNIQYYAQFEKIELLWEQAMPNAITDILLFMGTLFIGTERGMILALNPTDGSMLWTKTFSNSSSLQFSTVEDYIIAFSHNNALGLSTTGRELWSYSFSSNRVTYSQTDGEYLIQSLENWKIQIYRLQTLIKNKNNSIQSKNYGILDTKVDSYIMYTLELMQDRYAFLEHVASENRNGSISSLEPYYAFRLLQIARDTTENSANRGRAAHLLGQIGSYEYRKELINLAPMVNETSFAIGLLYGIASCGQDIEGETLMSIQIIAKNVGIQNSSVHYAICDTLYSLARYAKGDFSPIAHELVLYTKEQYASSVKKHALSLLARLFELE